MKYHIRVRADFSDTIEVEADNFEEADMKACQKFLDEFVETIGFEVDY